MFDYIYRFYFSDNVEICGVLFDIDTNNTIEAKNIAKFENKKAIDLLLKNGFIFLYGNIQQTACNNKMCIKSPIEFNIL